MRCVFCATEDPSFIDGACSVCHTVQQDHEIHAPDRALDEPRHTGTMHVINNRVWRRSMWMNAPSSKARAEHVISSEIRELCDRIGASKLIALDATELYQKGARGHHHTAVNKTCLMLAAIFFACKSAGAPRSVVELAAAGSMDTNLVKRACGRLMARAGMDFLEPSSAHQFVRRLASVLDLPTATAQAHVLKVLDATPAGAARPEVLAAAAFVASGIVALEVMSAAAGISEMALTRAVNAIKNSVSS